MAIEPRPNPTDSDSSGGGALVSLLFWLCLFVSAGLYAAAALAPRVLAWTELNREFLTNQAELVRSQHQLQHLQRVADALERDPDFAARVARRELDAVRPGAVTIPVPAELGSDPRIPLDVDMPIPRADPWYLPVIRELAVETTLRQRTMISAAVLLLFAFVVLNDGTLRLFGSLRSVRALGRRVFARYLRSDAASLKNG